MKNDDKNQKLIKQEQIYSLVKVIVKEHKVDIIEKIKKAKSKDKEVVRVVKEIKKIEVKVLKENK